MKKKEKSKKKKERKIKETLQKIKISKLEEKIERIKNKPESKKIEFSENIIFPKSKTSPPVLEQVAVASQTPFRLEQNIDFSEKKEKTIGYSLDKSREYGGNELGEKQNTSYSAQTNNVFNRPGIIDMEHIGEAGPSVKRNVNFQRPFMPQKENSQLDYIPKSPKRVEMEHIGEAGPSVKRDIDYKIVSG